MQHRENADHRDENAAYSGFGTSTLDRFWSTWAQLGWKVDRVW